MKSLTDAYSSVYKKRQEKQFKPHKCKTITESVQEVYSNVVQDEVLEPEKVKSLKELYEDVQIIGRNLKTGVEQEYGTATDTLAKHIHRQVSGANADIKKTIKKILDRGNFAGRSEIDYVDTLFNTTEYDYPHELLQLLANDPNAIFGLGSLLKQTTEFFNLNNVIKKTLEGKINTSGIEPLVKDLHLFTPSASTNVGAGEMIFSMFSDAKKGTGGDLMIGPGLEADESQIEVKASGKSGTGARFGGTSEATKAPRRLNYLINNSPIMKEEIKFLNKDEFIITKLLDYVEKIIGSKKYDDISEFYDKFSKEQFAGQPSILKKLTTIEFLDQPLTSQIATKSRRNGDNFIIQVHTLLSDNLSKIKNKEKNMKNKPVDYVGAILSFFSNINYDDPSDEAQMYDLALDGYTATRTYGEEMLKSKGLDLKLALDGFFGGSLAKVKSFDPNINPANFTKLIAAIHFACYHTAAHPFEYLLMTNDQNLNCMMINCIPLKEAENKILEAYKILDQNPIDIRVTVDRESTATVRGTSVLFTYQG